MHSNNYKVDLHLCECEVGNGRLQNDEAFCSACCSLQRQSKSKIYNGLHHIQYFDQPPIGIFKPSNNQLKNQIQLKNPFTALDRASRKQNFQHLRKTATTTQNQQCPPSNPLTSSAAPSQPSTPPHLAMSGSSFHVFVCFLLMSPRLSRQDLQ